MSEIKSYLQCGLTNDHIIKEPMNLLCGHFICKTCVPDKSCIKCKICNSEKNKSELQAEKESDFIKTIIKSNLSELLVDLEKHTIDEINKFKS